MIKIGDTVVVNKRSTIRKNGLVVLEKTRAHNDKVTQVYQDGRVRVSSGDTWSVKMGKNNEWSVVA